MSGAKLKTLVIAALVLLNLFFAALIAQAKISETAQYRATETKLAQVLGQSGISVVCRIPVAARFRAYDLQRDAYAEARFAATLLGECAETETDGAARFENDSGAIEFGTSGEFDARLRGWTVARGTERATAEKLLKKLKIDYTAITEYTESGYATLYAGLDFGGAVVNAGVAFEFADGELMRVSGRKIFRADETGGAEYYDAATLLTAFAAAVARGDFRCTEVRAVTVAYRARSDAFPGANLEPGLAVTADTGRWFINAADGTAEPAE
ncbi:MAG: hypothetical protein LBS90_03655 [Oscillospiraceae bacterium]|jgi:hypothetical protein|nr:hypothetical protein [Oscillospiraceae bacterium]